MDRLALGPAHLARILELCEAEPEREACGLVVRRGRELDVVQVENVADSYHAADPAAFPRTGRESYVMNPRALLRLHEGLEASGGQIVVVWHSHVEAGAHLSAMDREDAVFDGIPQIPGADQLVLGLRGGRVIEVKRYRYAAGAWLEEPAGGG